MIDSLLIQQIVAAKRHEDIVTILESRLGEVPYDVAEKIRSVVEQLTEMVRQAASCRDMESFGKALP